MYRSRHFGTKIGSKTIVYTEWQEMTIPVHDMIVSYNRFCELAENIDVEYKDVTLVKDLIAEDYKDVRFVNGRKIEEYKLRKYFNREAVIKDKTLIVM